MRKALLLGLIGACMIAGAAYGATTITNVYIVHGRIVPVKSGTKAHPIPAGGHIDFSVTTNPAGQRPNIVKTILLRVQGLTENTNRFKACGTARLTNPGEGPSTCPKTSLVGTGYLVADISKPGDQTPSGTVLTCRVELSIYNGGNHDLSYYLFANPTAPATQSPPECPSSGPAAFKPEAFVAALTKTRKGLVESATFPSDVLHPFGGAFDAAVIKSSVNIIALAKRVKVGPAGHKRTVTIGLFATNSCPANHKRQVALTFRQENGGSRTVTKLQSCHY
jgi:hypothetical protein